MKMTWENIANDQGGGRWTSPVVGLGGWGYSWLVHKEEGLNENWSSGIALPPHPKLNKVPRDVVLPTVVRLWSSFSYEIVHEAGRGGWMFSAASLLGDPKAYLYLG